MVFGFNALLDHAGVSPSDVTLLFHTTTLPILRRMLPWLAAERPDLFDAYQSVHSLTAERTLANRPLVAAFVPIDRDDMAFVALYRILAMQDRPTSEIYSDARFAELERDYGATDTSPAQNMVRAARQLVFEMVATDDLADLRGRVVVRRPAGRAYARLAERLDPSVLRIEADPVLTVPPPDWRTLTLTGQELRALPASWANRLREWRGIYLIVDEVDGARYVGAAYGEDNLLGRWREHARQDQGVTVELIRRSPLTFRFSILERVSPDMAAEDVIVLERTWMERLHTIRYGLNR